MNRYTRIRKYIDINEVKRSNELRIAEQIALKEKKYLLYFIENTVPKYYDWEEGHFNKTSLAEIKIIVLKRLEEIESALSEGMKMKDFNYLYGGELGNQILSINPTLVSSTFAQNLIRAGGEVTSTMFGPDFPGSHINSIGNFDKPESLSKVDAQAHQGNRDTTSNNAFPHTEEGHRFPYQADDYTLPTDVEMNTTRDSVQEAGYYDNQLMQMIWPNYGQVITDPNTNTEHPWDEFPIPTDEFFTNKKSYDMNNLTQAQLDDVRDTRLGYPAGRFGGLSGTYHHDNHFLDINYGQARSIDGKTFDLGIGLDYLLDQDEEPEPPLPQLGSGEDLNFQQHNFGPGWDYNYSSTGTDFEDSTDKEHWQYITYGEFLVSHFEDIVGVKFPPALVEKYRDSDDTIYTEYQQLGGEDYFDRDDSDFPNGPQNTANSAYYDISSNKKVIQNAQVGQKISFDYRLATTQYWDNYNYGYAGDGSGDEGNFLDYIDGPVQIYTIAGKNLTKIYDMHRELPDEEVTMDYGLEMLNGLDATGSGEYIIRQEDIDPVTGALDFYVVLIADSSNWTILNVTNFEMDRVKTSPERSAGSVADTTPAYDLGAPVAALASSKGKGKKKKDEEEEDEIDSTQDSDTETKEEDPTQDSDTETEKEDPTQDSEDSDTETKEEDPTQDSEDSDTEAIKSSPRKENKNGQTLANPGEPSDRLGLLLKDGESEDDFHYYKGYRYSKGSLQDTGIPIGTSPKYVGDKSIPYVHDYKPGYVYSNLQVTFSTDEMKKKFEAHKDAVKAKYKNKSNAWWASQPYHLNSLWKITVSTPFPGARPFVDVGEKAPAESDGLEGLFDSEKLKNKYGEGLFAEFGKIYQKLNTIIDAGKAFAAFLLQQQGVNNYTKINPYEVQLPAEDKKAIANAINKLFETQIPEERWNNLSQADLDLINDTLNPESGPTPTNPYRKGTGANEDEYHNIFNNLGEKKGIKVKVTTNGKPYVSEINDNYVFTDPDDATVKGAPELIKFFTTAAGAQKRKGAAGGGKYTYQQFSGNIDQLNLKMKNMPIRLRLPTPVSEELYPGQPSPNGFPDILPPKLAPNGYHPDYGKQAKRYTKLDPVSAVMMKKVGTEDPETNKLVAAAAQKPKVEKNKKDKVSEAVWPKGLWRKAKRYW